MLDLSHYLPKDAPVQGWFLKRVVLQLLLEWQWFAKWISSTQPFRDSRNIMLDTTFLTPELTSNQCRHETFHLPQHKACLPQGLRCGTAVQAAQIMSALINYLMTGKWGSTVNNQHVTTLRSRRPLTKILHGIKDRVLVKMKEFSVGGACILHVSIADDHD